MAVVFVQWHTVRAWSVGSVLEYRMRSTVVAVGNLSETLEEKSGARKGKISIVIQIQCYWLADSLTDR